MTIEQKEQIKDVLGDSHTLATIAEKIQSENPNVASSKPTISRFFHKNEGRIMHQKRGGTYIVSFTSFREVWNNQNKQKNI